MAAISLLMFTSCGRPTWIQRAFAKGLACHSIPDEAMSSETQLVSLGRLAVKKKDDVPEPRQGELAMVGVSRSSVEVVPAPR